MFTLGYPMWHSKSRLLLISFTSANSAAAALCFKNCPDSRVVQHEKHQLPFDTATPDNSIFSRTRSSAPQLAVYTTPRTAAVLRHLAVTVAPASPARDPLVPSLCLQIPEITYADA